MKEENECSSGWSRRADVGGAGGANEFLWNWANETEDDNMSVAPKKRSIKRGRSEQNEAESDYNSKHQTSAVA